MPVVVVQIWEGRTVGQKRRLARAITDAMIEHMEANPSGLHVAIQEYTKENWARAGVLGIDRKDTDAKPARDPRVFRVGHLLLQTADLDAAERFYVDFLGLTVRERGSFRDGRPLIVTDQGLGLTDGRPDGGNPVEHVAFSARNIDAIAAKARDQGVTILDGPAPSAYGTSLYLADPDGNRVEVYGDADLPQDEP
jgi:4-oxalocrotonate tautomerase family enzyme